MINAIPAQAGRTPRLPLQSSRISRPLFLFVGGWVEEGHTFSFVLVCVGNMDCGYEHLHS